MAFKIVRNDITHVEGRLNRYGFVTFNQFGLLGPETMNSAQTIVNDIITEAFGKCDDEKILMLKKGHISANFMLELFSNECSNAVLLEWLDAIKGLSEFLDIYHTIGNYVLVPAYFNSYRASVVDDYWDKSLALMKKKSEAWLSNKNEIVWDRKLFVRYVNYFFLWDYTDDYDPLIISEISNTNDLEHFLEITSRKIRLRGKFMVAMLRINDVDSNYYVQLFENIFNTDTRFKNYDDVLKAMKEMTCYSDSKVREIIMSLEEEL